MLDGWSESDTHHAPDDGDGFRVGLNPSYDLPDGLIDLPDGQISPSAEFLSSPSRKNISVFPKSKSSYMIRRPASLEGRFAIVTDARRDAVDADALRDERH